MIHYQSHWLTKHPPNLPQFTNTTHLFLNYSLVPSSWILAKTTYQPKISARVKITYKTSALHKLVKRRDESLTILFCLISLKPTLLYFSNLIGVIFLNAHKNVPSQPIKSDVGKSFILFQHHFVHVIIWILYAPFNCKSSNVILSKFIL